jgi:hypothetical protein
MPAEPLDRPAIAAAVSLLRQAIAAAPSDEQSSEPAGIHTAGEALLALLRPAPGGHPLENLRIRESGLPVKVRVALADLWEALRIPGWASRAAGRARDGYLDFLDDLTALLPEEGPTQKLQRDLPSNRRPSEPTPEYCLPKRGVIRWKGERKDVPERLCDLLDQMLAAGDRPIPFGAVGERNGTIGNKVTDLSKILLDVDFPWRPRVRCHTIVRGHW